MISPNRPILKLSPMDWYKLGSSLLFVILGGFIIVRFLLASPRRYVTPLIMGGLILAYGLYRVIAAYRNLREISHRDTEHTEK
jgi:hypothetical protein